MANVELVIKIPEEMYQKIKETNMIIGGRRNGKRFDYILFNAVNTGTPLPKGHGRLIDVKDLKKDLVYMSDYSDAKGVWEEDIDDAETIIEADKESDKNANND